jgi:hypothetical protein
MGRYMYNIYWFVQHRMYIYIYHISHIYKYIYIYININTYIYTHTWVKHVCGKQWHQQTRCSISRVECKLVTDSIIACTCSRDMPDATSQRVGCTARSLQVDWTASCHGQPLKCCHRKMLWKSVYIYIYYIINIYVDFDKKSMHARSTWHGPSWLQYIRDMTGKLSKPSYTGNRRSRRRWRGRRSHSRRLRCRMRGGYTPPQIWKDPSLISIYHKTGGFLFDFLFLQVNAIYYINIFETWLPCDFKQPPDPDLQTKSSEQRLPRRRCLFLHHSNLRGQGQQGVTEKGEAFSQWNRIIGCENVWTLNIYYIFICVSEININK